MSAVVKHLKLATVVFGVVIGLAGVVHASMFFVPNGNDAYYVSSLAEYHTLFGATTTGYGTAGIYQETNTSTPTVTKLGTGSGGNVPGLFEQNTSPNASSGLQLFGWGASLNNGYPVSTHLMNLQNPFNGTNLYFQYKTGVTGGLFGNGTTTAFNFNGFNLRGSTANANLTFTVEGFLGGNMVDSAVLNVTGNVDTTFTENWTNVDTVEIVSTAANPVNWGSGTLYMDSVEINDPITSAVPEPSSLIIWSLLGGIGLTIGWRRWWKAA